jgi:peptide/nickel transport system ATP-binding protein
MNLSVHGGRITALVGESGSGKTAAALTVMGIQAENARIKGGEIFLAGEDILKLSGKYKRSYISRRAGIIFQDPVDTLNPLYTVGRQLVETILIHEKMSKKSAVQIAVEHLRRLRLPDPEQLMKKYPFMLSGGMCQRVMIAMAAVSKPLLLIADEPTTALDVTVQDRILYHLDRMRKNGKTGILLITHDLGVVAEIADDVYIIRHGRVVEYAGVNDIFRNSTNVYTRLLLDAAI